MASKFFLTESAVTGVPSLNVTPSLSLNVNDVASGLISQLSASHGVMSPVFGSWSVNESTTWRVT